MLRLPSLDEHLAALLRRLARGALQDSVLLLLSDHGTHGIWYNDFELGAAEHKLPLLYVVAPDWLLQRNPRWQEGLAANQQRLVTARACLPPPHTPLRNTSLYATLHALPHSTLGRTPLARPYVPSQPPTGVRYPPDDARAARVARRAARWCRDALAPRAYAQP